MTPIADEGTSLIDRVRREFVIAAVPALDRLNSWVRSESFRESLGGGPREAIYWLKNEAIRALHGYGLTTHRAVYATAKCRDCGGSGRYVDSMGYRHDHCWACNSAGEVRLNFVETAIEGGPTWHTPWLKFPLIRGEVVGSYSPDFSDAVEATDWKPNLRGRDLTPAEVARDLNRAEAAFPKRPGVRYTEWGEYDPFNYKLFVGASDRDKCDLCGHAVEDDSGCGYHCSRGRIAWCAYGCNVCSALHGHEGNGIKIFSLFGLPRSFIDHPDILEWIVRHPVMKKPTSRSFTTPVPDADGGGDAGDGDDIPFLSPNQRGKLSR